MAKHRLLSVIFLMGLLSFTGCSRETSLVLVNTTPYDIRFAVNHDLEDGGHRTFGWMTLSPGDTWSTQASFGEVEPQFYVYSETTSPRIVRLVHPDETSNTIYEFTKGDRWLLVPKDYPNISSDFDEVSNEPYDETSVLADSSLSKRKAAFEALPSPAPGIREFVWYFKENTMRIAADQAAADYREIDPGDAYIACRHARDVRTALDRYLEENSKWQGYYLPVHLHESIQDINGVTQLGVQVTAIPTNHSTYASDSLYESPFQVGDLITKINDTPVFTEWDVLFAVIVHSQSVEKGVRVPMIVEYKRGGTENRGHVPATYCFNPHAWPQDHNQGLAFIKGAWQSYTCGIGDKALPIAQNVGKGLYNLALWAVDSESSRAEYVDVSKTQWELTQRTARLKQFYPDAFGKGEFIGFFGSPTALVRGAIVRGGTKTLARRLGERAIIEMGEAAVYEIATRPATQSDEELRDEIEYVLPRAAAVGVVAKLLLRGS